VKWLVGLLVGCAFALFAAPSFASPSGAYCEELEAALRYDQSHGGTAQWQIEQLEEETATCWRDLQQEEAAEAEQHTQEQEEIAHEKVAKHGHRPPGLRRGITVRRKTAEAETLHALHGALRWRTRTRGFIDCTGGRINRIIWNCKFEWTNGRAIDWCGHSEVTGERLQDGRGRYKTAWRATRCP
jgi:hypothetical protein